MSDRPKKQCKHSGCVVITEHESGICERHRTLRREQQQSQKEKDRRRIYSTARWRKLRAYKLQHNPICEWEGCEKPAEDVHHIIDIQDEPQKALELENLQSLCKQHHSKITARENKEKGLW